MKLETHLPERPGLLHAVPVMDIFVLLWLLFLLGPSLLRQSGISVELPPSRFQLDRYQETLVITLGPGETGPEQGTLESLDRLLWGYLRMIWGATTLSEFIEHTDDGAIRERIADLEKRLAKLPSGDDSAARQLRSALEDHLATSRERLSNIEDAKRKLDVVAAEIERLEAKIAALAEGSVAKRDVSDLAKRVDEVAEGMRKTDETMRQLQLPPELEDLDEPPPMLREEA